VLRGNGIVFLFSDFYPHADRTAPVRWFGRAARLPSGLLHIAACSNVPVSIAETHIDDTFREWIEVTPFLPAAGAGTADVQRLAAVLERRIKVAPDQWRCWEHFEQYFHQPVSAAQRDVIRQLRKRSEYLV
jgi:lauroyl/myristoyl acyltransferase